MFFNLFQNWFQILLFSNPSTNYLDQEIKVSRPDKNNNVVNKNIFYEYSTVRFVLIKLPFAI